MESHPALRGLTSTEVAERRTAGLTNEVKEVTSRSLGQIVTANVFTRFNALLGVLFVLVLLTGSFIDGLFGIALVLNTVLGIGQEWYAKRKLDSLALLHAPTATVLRDGEQVSIGVGEVVVDDLVCLTPGDQIPADGSLVDSMNLEVDESNLTGESDPQIKHLGDEVFSGTAVVAGSGVFRTEVVGEQATAQRLATEAKKFTRAYSEVQASTNRLLRWITWVLVVMFPVALVAQYRGLATGSWTEVASNWRTIVLRSAGGLVAMVPEGLVLLTTLAFLLAALQLTRHQALVQELPAVEALARVDVICLDKTGTLTAGEITFDHCEFLEGADEFQAREALASFAASPHPNATILALAPHTDQPTHAVIDHVEFSSARKYSAITWESGLSWVLGAPEIIAGAHGDLMARVDRWSDKGVRCVLLAQVDSLENWGTPQPCALVLLSEQVRPDAGRTLEYFASQDVSVKIISGDNPVTVAAVARKVGLDLGPDSVVDARTLPDTIEELTDIVDSITVFGRVSPEKKRLLVGALKARGHTVAMTGDGVNDILALKDADIGIAMGNGASATKAVAQIVLVDSRFSHMPTILAEGRRLIGNVERVAALFVTKNVMAASLILATAILGVSFPFLPRHMTLLSVLTIGIPAAILALGPNSRKYVPGFLTRVLGLALPAGLAAGIATFIAFTLGVGSSPQRSTLALMVLFIVNFWLLGVLARPWNWWKILTISVMVSLAVTAMSHQFTRRFFQLDLPSVEIGAAFLIGGCGAAVVEIAHQARRALSLNHPYEKIT
ncbi:MAG: HAD-IC family P-type ATPase [Propionibacteriaceae bacterium]|nr:HAD-IC family P-type ATPase [Propionibacteriaceae bacterium]